MSIYRREIGKRHALGNRGKRQKCLWVVEMEGMEEKKQGGFLSLTPSACSFAVLF